MPWISAQAQMTRVRCGLAAIKHRIWDADVAVFELSGHLRGRTPVKVLYAGRASRLEELRLLLFSGMVEKERLHSLHVSFSPHVWIDAEAASADLTVTEAWPWETSDDDSGYVIQAWLDAWADPGDDWDACRTALASCVKRTLKRAHEAGWVLSETKDLAAMERFYSTMLLPLARQRFGMDVFVPDRDTFLRRGENEDRRLLLLQKQGEPLAGCVVVVAPQRRELWMLHMGAATPLLEDRDARSQTVALFNAWAFEHACQQHLRVNMALTRPFLDDGVFIHKRHWRCWLLPVPALDRFRLKLNPRRAGELLGAAPFFHLAPDGVRAVMALPHGGDAAHQLQAQLASDVFDGLKGITVQTGDAQDTALQLSSSLPSYRQCPITYVSGPQVQRWTHGTCDV